MGKALNRVLKVVKQSDVLIEVVDSRFPERSRRLAKIVRRQRKPMLLVQNKTDLLEEEVREGTAFCASRAGKTPPCA